MALIEKYNTPRWVIDLIVTPEMCALGDRLRMHLSVHSTFAQLCQHLERDFFVAPAACPPHMVQMPPSFLLPTARRTPENSVWHGLNLHLSGLVFLIM